MNITIKIHTNPDATYEDLSCALKRIQQAVGILYGDDLIVEGPIHFKMDGLPVADVMVEVER